MNGEEVGVPCLGQGLGLPELLNPLRGSGFDESAQIVFQMLSGLSD
jgi:hypothetical protein